MRIFIKLAVVMFLMLPSHANAKVVGEALDLVGADIFSDLDKSVNNLFGRIDSTIVGMRSNAEGLLASARSNMSDFLDKSVDELEGQERTMWLYYNNALNQLDQRVDSYSRTARITVLDTVNALTVVVPFSSNEPVIHWVEIEPPLYDHTANERRVIAFGTNLNRDGNALEANGMNARRVNNSPTEIIFALDGVDITEGLELSFRLSGKRTFWNFLGSWTDRKFLPKNFELPRQPDFVGTAQLIYLEDSFDIINRRWPNDGSYRSANCQRGGTFGTSGCTARFGPEFIANRNGYSVIVDTIRHSKDTHGCRGTSVRVSHSEVSANGFRVAGTAYPNSGAGRRCYLNARFTWQERRNVANKIENLSEPQDIRRSLNGVTFRFPTQGTNPIGISVIHEGSDTAEIYDLATIRANLAVNHQPGTGILEVVWRE